MDGIDAVLRRFHIEKLETYFQPVYNLRTGSIMGAEALLRPRTTAGDHLAPAVLFQGAETDDRLPELDQAARITALKTFTAELPSRDIILFLNLSSTLVDVGRVDGKLILSTIRHYGLAIRNVAVELAESNVRDLDALVRFSNSLRQAGFLICVDNFGTERSNLERLASLRPDIVKIDRSVIQGVSDSPRKRAVLRSIAYVSRALGALCLVQGVEAYEDLEICRIENIDLAQGFLLGRPAPSVESMFHRKESAATYHFDLLKQKLPEYLRERRGRFRYIHEKIDVIVQTLSGNPFDILEARLEQVIRDLDVFDAGYILDGEGIQVSRTIMTRPRKRQERHPVFHPTPVGTDHLLMDYAYGPGALDHDRFTSQPYRSLNSGELCRTISRRFTTVDGQVLVVCVDIPEEADQ